VRTAQRGAGEDGATLILALAFLAAFSLLIPALMGLGSASLAQTSRLQEQRAEVYAADAATDGALQYLRSVSGAACGKIQQTSATCPLTTGVLPTDISTFTASLNNKTATTTITARGTLLDLERTVDLDTRVDGNLRVSAHAVIRDGSSGEKPIDVQTWTYKRF
jgi:hypothetical protein